MMMITGRGGVSNLTRQVVIFLYKIGAKTGLNVAEIGSEFTTGQFAEKNAKMRGVGYLID